MTASHFKIGSALFSGIVVGSISGVILMAWYSEKVLLISDASNAAQTIGVLYHLREQSLQDGINLLENQVDRSLTVLAENPSALKDGEVQRALSMAKAYRAKYPFTNEVPQIRDLVGNLLSAKIVSK